jgi:hypothetical protein
MKIAEGFSLKTIADNNIVVPVGSNTVSFKAIITLNESGAFLWRELETEKDEEQLVKAMLDEYDVDEATVRKDVSEFIENMRAANLLV